MAKIYEIRKFAPTIPPGARYVSVISEHANSVSVDYYSDPDGRRPIRINVSPTALVIGKDDFQAMTEASTPVAPEAMKKVPSQPGQKGRKLRKGDKSEDDERGAMKFPHSDAEKEWADNLAFDAKKDAQTLDYPDYRQTGIDDSMFIYGREAEKQMRKQ